MAQQLSAMTKAVAVALDIAGRPDTDDAYALNSVRKAYSLLNGATFQDFVESQPETVKAHDFGFDWMDAYRLEAEKADALAEQVRALEAEISKARAGVASRQERPNPPPTQAASNETAPMQRTERVRERIVAALREGDCTGQELSGITKVHLRTVQRRLRELIAIGVVAQATDDLSPLYTLTISRH